MPTQNQAENAFIQFKKLLVHVKVLPHVSNSFENLTWEHYKNIFVSIFVWIGSLKLINNPVISPVWLFPNHFNAHGSFFSISIGFHTSGD